jgi:hypothetical protein
MIQRIIEFLVIYIGDCKLVRPSLLSNQLRINCDAINYSLWNYVYYLVNFCFVKLLIITTITILSTICYIKYRQRINGLIQPWLPFKKKKRTVATQTPTKTTKNVSTETFNLHTEFRESDLDSDQGEDEAFVPPRPIQQQTRIYQQSPQTFQPVQQSTYPPYQLQQQIFQQRPASPTYQHHVASNMQYHPTNPFLDMVMPSPDNHQSRQYQQVVPPIPPRTAYNVPVTPAQAPSLSPIINMSRQFNNSPIQQQIQRVHSPLPTPHVHSSTASPVIVSDHGSTNYHCNTIDYYYGTEDDLDAWFRTFDRVARASNWNNIIKAQKFPIWLKGKALAVFEQQPRYVQDDYDTCRQIMIRELQTKTVSEEVAEFYQRKQQENESVDEYVDDLRRMVDKCFNRMPVEERSNTLLQRFIDGIKPELRRGLTVSRPKDIVEAVQLARRLDKIDRDVSLINAVQQSTPATSNQQRFRQRSQSAPRTPKRVQFNGHCLNCNKYGHKASECYRRRSQSTGRNNNHTNNNQQQTTNSSSSDNNQRSSRSINTPTPAPRNLNAYTLD